MRYSQLSECRIFNNEPKKRMQYCAMLVFFLKICYISEEDIFKIFRSKFMEKFQK